MTNAMPTPHIQELRDDIRSAHERIRTLEDQTTAHHNALMALVKQFDRLERRTNLLTHLVKECSDIYDQVEKLTQEDYDLMMHEQQ